jgi:hypothetical protein
MTGYYTFENVDQKTQECIYKTIGIDRNGREYTGNYLYFDPLCGLEFKKCFSVFENEKYQNEFRKEYFASSLSPLF